MPRDEFSTSTKRLLAQRVCHRCSNPECRRPTSGPSNDPERSSNIGVAAHIKGASPGGPRYDPDQASADRRSFQNGIWLCQSCAKLIDDDVYRYRVDVLHRWKQMAEKAARTALERNTSSETALDTFLRLAEKMPTLIQEMAEDLQHDPNALVREFVVLQSNSIGFQHTRRRFEYYETDHPNVQNAVQLLEEYGLVTHFKPKNHPIFRMTELFVELVTTLYPVTDSA